MWFRKRGFDPEKHILQIREYKRRVEQIQCPKCGEKKLKVDMLEEGKEGYETIIHCSSCLLQSLLSESGFNVKFNIKVKEGKK